MIDPYEPTKIYVAARFDDRDIAIVVANLYTRAGLVVTSTWLTPFDTATMDQLKTQKRDVVKECRSRAVKDFEDIDAAQVFVQLSPKEGFRNGTGGKHVELGYAIATGKQIFIVGDRENVFHYHPRCRLVGRPENVLEALEVLNA